MDGSVGQAVDPALFSPGACLAFAPTSGDRHETVFLDAGHGGIDPGAVGSTEIGQTVDEAPVNLASNWTPWRSCAPRATAWSSRAPRTPP